MAQPANRTDVVDHDFSRLVEPMALRMWQMWRGRQRVFDLNDLRQAGVKGMLLAWSAFDPTHGVSFATFGHRAAWGAMVALVGTSSALSGRAIRHGREWTETVTMPHDVPMNDTEPRATPDVSEYLDMLPQAYRETVVMHLGIGGESLTFHEIAVRRGQKIGTVTSQYTRAMAKLRQMFAA